jgi:hypothetical protein
MKFDSDREGLWLSSLHNPICSVSFHVFGPHSCFYNNAIKESYFRCSTILLNPSYKLPRDAAGYSHEYDDRRGMRMKRWVFNKLDNRRS